MPVRRPLRVGDPERPTQMGRESITIHSNGKEYFFSTRHSQDTPEEFIPVTFGPLPYRVTPRESLPDGIIKTVDDLLTIYFRDEVEIPNPNPRYAIDYRELRGETKIS